MEETAGVHLKMGDQQLLHTLWYVDIIHGHWSYHLAKGSSTNLTSNATLIQVTERYSHGRTCALLNSVQNSLKYKVGCFWRFSYVYTIN